MLGTISIPHHVAPQKHNLWQSAYHLIHPADGDLGENASRNPSNAISSNLVAYETPGVASDFRYGLRPNQGLTYNAECYPAEAGCWQPCDPDVECQDETNPTFEKVPNCPASDTTFYPFVIYQAITCSTFGFEEVDYFGRAKRALDRTRSIKLEKVLVNGDCLTDDTDDTTPLNTPLSGADLDLINSGTAVSAKRAFIELDQWLATSTPVDIGMIHLSPAVASLAQDYIYEEKFDLGDGLGPRQILRSKTTGNIVVAAPGLVGENGPGADIPTAVQQWVYATPLVYLVWDHMIVPDRLNGWTRTNVNQVEIQAEQVVGLTYQVCQDSAGDPTANTVAAAKVDITA